MSKGPQLNGQIKGDQEVLSREETLRILSEMTRAGSVSAAIALERALRLGDGASTMTMRTTCGPSSTRFGRLAAA